MPITYQAHMNPSHVVYGACMRDCGVEGYGGPQGPWKLLDNGDFGLATWEHQSWFQHVFLPIGNKGEPSPSINYEAFLSQKKPILVVASFSTTMKTHLSSATASIPPTLTHSAAASIPAAINSHKASPSSKLFLPSKH
ncbi:unnamed protein product [Prunus armeniaca]